MVVAVGWHAYGLDVVAESQRRAQTHKSNVVGIAVRVVVGVHDDLRNLSGHLTLIICTKVVVAGKDAESRRLGGVSVDAMGGGNDPLVANNGAAASLLAGSAGTGGGTCHTHRYLPGPAEGNGIVTTDNSGLIRRNRRNTALRVRHCHQGGQNDYYSSLHCFPELPTVR